MNNLQPYLLKLDLIKQMRRFFYDQGFQEVDSPVLNHALPLQPNLHAFSTKWQTQDINQDNTQDKTQELYLSTSPEVNLKKILSFGADQPEQSNILNKIFTIGHAFRNRESADEDHNPEFLMLEWYRADADYQDLMLDMKQLITTTASKIESPLSAGFNQASWPVYSLDNLFKQETGKSIQQLLDMSQLTKLAKSYNFTVEQSNWEQLFNQIFVSKIEPGLPEGPFFLIDYPARISPLCKPRQDKPHLAERFEFYLAGSELANGNTEQTDPKIVKQHFLKEKEYRQQNNLPAPKIDSDFISALEKLQQSGRTYAGVGLGLERLAMILADASNLNQVNPFTL